MAEVLEGLPGGWDGVSDASFAAALDACLQMPASQLATIRDVLAARYSWKQSVADTVAVYRGLLPGDAGGCP
jgi:hypothetical protein